MYTVIPSMEIPRLSHYELVLLKARIEKFYPCSITFHERVDQLPQPFYTLAYTISDDNYWIGYLHISPTVE